MAAEPEVAACLQTAQCLVSDHECVDASAPCDNQPGPVPGGETG